MEKEIPSSGSIKQYSLYQILASLDEHQKKGILTVTNNDIKKEIYIEDGYVIFVSSNQLEERLGVLLTKDGKITNEQRDESLQQSKKTGKRQGITLVELGYLNPKTLFVELKNQIKEMIFSVFLWEEGTFEFKENSLSSDLVRVKVKIDSLIHEGLMSKEQRSNEEQNSFLQDISEFHEQLSEQRLSYYDILKVNFKASLSDIKKAYLKMARIYHPDVHYHLPSPEMSAKLTDLFTFINKAFETLNDQSKREEYDAILLKKKEENVPVDETSKAEEQFKRGIGEYKTGNFWGATDFLRGATRKDPNKATYWAYLSLALSKMPNRNKEAEETILKAIELEPHNANFYICLGNIYVNYGMYKRAIRQFEAALSWDPTNDKALRELEKLREKSKKI
ncbi:MAG: DnaJ domain-containing protein [Thermodesulfovibrionia bacterium]|nr:DnaJ domain-containing protein [Thermodesulfovibrionia bacterium]MCK5511799.1 DnaJ domain-containing protein [Thermodesulfovibrionia bacterium]